MEQTTSSAAFSSCCGAADCQRTSISRPFPPVSPNESPAKRVSFGKKEQVRAVELSATREAERSVLDDDARARFPVFAERKDL